MLTDADAKRKALNTSLNLFTTTVNTFSTPLIMVAYGFQDSATVVTSTIVPVMKGVLSTLVAYNDYKSPSLLAWSAFNMIADGIIQFGNGWGSETLDVIQGPHACHSPASPISAANAADSTQCVNSTQSISNLSTNPDYISGAQTIALNSAVVGVLAPATFLAGYYGFKLGKHVAKNLLPKFGLYRHKATENDKDLELHLTNHDQTAESTQNSM